jgi:hypothetical protein
MVMAFYKSIIGFYVVLAALTGFMAAGVFAYIEQRAFISVIYDQPIVALTEIRV